ncbi:MAG TPA: hydroxyacylglutathione hydrolase [Beijerinckiaceae bacterium]|nr:hydroxyacylglutathione hydrolase [Beijerinckiaceae bacterium]
MTVHIHQFTCLSDNFGVLAHDSETGATASIDAPDAAPILAALDQKGWRLTDILVTHHHADHIQGIPALREKFPNARIVAPQKDAGRIAPIDLAVAEGDVVHVGELAAVVIETPGHTSGHIAYWFEEEDLLFAGDTLFAMGCGRVFEAPMQVMWSSLVKLAGLPAETQVYCGHEYTLANGRFALTVDPDNEILRSRVEEIARMRAAGQATLPSTIQLELATNPFLRAEDPMIQRGLGMSGSDPAEVFAELRERKNRF